MRRNLMCGSTGENKNWDAISAYSCYLEVSIILEPWQILRAADFAKLLRR
jgi:hypothetical protein